MKQLHWILTMSAAAMLAASSLATAGGPGARHHGHDSEGKGHSQYGHRYRHAPAYRYHGHRAPPRHAPRYGHRPAYGYGRHHGHAPRYRHGPPPRYRHGPPPRYRHGPPPRYRHGPPPGDGHGGYGPRYASRYGHPGYRYRGHRPGYAVYPVLPYVPYWNGGVALHFRF
jgi:hypothetical protein